VKLADIYRICWQTGIANDARGTDEIERVLAEVASDHEKSDDEERGFFDTEKLTNPYSDTRICSGDPDDDIRGLLVGIDIEVGEVLLAERLRQLGSSIDLVFAHHPEGPGYANLHEVMYMQADYWASHGVGLGAADNLIAPRAEEVRRSIMPRNHYRSVDAARLLGLASLSCHTPADNAVNTFVQSFLDERRPATLGKIVRQLRTIPEYADAARKGYGPTIVQGSESGRPGRIMVDMTGGTEGPKDALDRLSAAGVDTLVGMHYSEEHKKRATELSMNLVVAGHISSDALGMNLVLDEIAKAGDVEVLCCSGMIRVAR
jgi:hypothetical protein